MPESTLAASAVTENLDVSKTVHQPLSIGDAKLLLEIALEIESYDHGLEQPLISPELDLAVMDFDCGKLIGSITQALRTEALIDIDFENVPNIPELDGLVAKAESRNLYDPRLKIVSAFIRENQDLIFSIVTKGTDYKVANQLYTIGLHIDAFPMTKPR